METVYEFNYTGSEQSVTLKPGKYKFECWGACGGHGGNPPSDAIFGHGGYSCGELILKKSTKFYVYVGQVGLGSNSTVNSFNGGGRGNSIGGGGATDIRLVGGDWDNPQGLLSRIIVAGGGGGVYFGTSSTAIKAGFGGGFEGVTGKGVNNTHTPGGTQFQGGISSIEDGNGIFGIGGTPAGTKYIAYCGGGGGWYGGGCSYSVTCGGGGGSSYALTKDSYKPKGYIPTYEYFLENVESVAGANTNGTYGYAQITLLQALPFLNVSSYNSTTATFKADHTDSTLLTKIEVFIDGTLKETITTDLTLEKTINYTLEDNALHTLKIVVTDSANATAEKVVSISKNIMPLGDNASLQDIENKVSEMKDGLINGKTSIVNVLGLKNIESSLNNTLVELSEKIKSSFDSGDSSLQDLTNKLTQANNTITQLQGKIGKFKSGTTTVETSSGNLAYVSYYDNDTSSIKVTGIRLTNIGFKPNVVFIKGSGGGYYDFYTIAFDSNLTSKPNFCYCASLDRRNSSYDKHYYVKINQSSETNDNAVGMYNDRVFLPFLFTGSNPGATFDWFAIKYI
ncbi:glycine-rich protein [Clostridioides difficile]|nr:hypothetical protein [Clostridioides difficile]